MDAGVTVERHRKAEQEFRVAAAASAAPHRDRGLAARDQDAGTGRGLAMRGALAGDPGHHARHLGGLALDGTAEDDGFHAGPARHGRRGFERILWCRGHDDAAAGEDGVAGLRCLGHGIGQARRDGGRRHDAVAGQHAAGFGERRGIGHGRAGRDDRGVVARHIRDHQGDHGRRSRGRGQAATLDGRQVLPHAVHLVDAGSASEQGAVDRLLVGETDDLDGQRQQGRAAS